MSELSTNFWIAGIALIIAAVVLVAVPLLRGRGNRTVAVSLGFLAIVLPLATVATYLTVTTQDWDKAAAANAAMEEPDAEAMVAQLEQRLYSEGGSVDEWLMLGRSKVTMQSFPDALNAFTKAWEVSGETSVEAALGMGEAMTYLNRDSLKDEAGDLVEWALAQEPNNPRALWFGGLVSLARDQQQQAAERWTELLRYEMPDELRAVIQQQLASLPPVEAQNWNESKLVSFDVTVRIHPDLTGPAANASALFVFIRDPENPGPPLAVKRLAPQLPATVVLSDADVMLPGATLAGKSKLEVAARLSMSGDPIGQPGDIEGTVTWTDAGENRPREASVIISTVR